MTNLRELSYKTPNGAIVVSKDNLATAQNIFGNSKIGWKQCHETPNGVAFFLEICELFNLEFVPDDIPANSDNRKIYFDLCDQIALAILPPGNEQAFVDMLANQYVEDAPLEVDIYSIVNNKDEAPVDEPIKEVVVTNVTITNEEAAIADETPEMTENTTEDMQELNNNLKEDSSMNQEINMGEMLNETIKEAESNIEAAVNENGSKIGEAVGAARKYLVIMQEEAERIGKMSDKEVYNHVMNKIDEGIERFSHWTGVKYQVVADALKEQREKILKAKKDTEDAVDAEGLDDESKAGVMQKIMGFFGRIMRTTLLVAKSVLKFAFKLVGITLTLAYRIGRNVVVETIGAGKAVGVAFTDTVAEIKEGVSPSKADAVEDSEEEFDDQSIVVE